MIDRRRGQGSRRWCLGAGIALAVTGAAHGAYAQTPPAATAPAPGPAAAPAPVTRKAPPAAVTFYGSPTSPIAGGVAIPAGAAWVWTSGTGPPVVNKDAPAGDIARFGDTKTQARGVLNSIETQLAAQGLTMADVLLQDPRHAEALRLRLGRAGQRLLGGEAGARDVGADDGAGGDSGGVSPALGAASSGDGPGTRPP